MAKSLLNNLLGRFGIRLDKAITKLVSNSVYDRIALMYKIISSHDMGERIRNILNFEVPYEGNIKFWGGGLFFVSFFRTWLPFSMWEVTLFTELLYISSLSGALPSTGYLFSLFSLVIYLRLYFQTLYSLFLDGVNFT